MRLELAVLPLLVLVLISLNIPFATVASEPLETATSNTKQIALGADLYAAYCARCHGTDMIEPGDGYFDLRTFPAEQRSRFVDSVTNGKGSMPPWRSILSPTDIDNLFAYVTYNKR